MPEILPGLSYREYNEIDADRASVLFPYGDTLAHVKHAKYNQEESDADHFVQGDLLHAILNEPHTVGEKFMSAPKCDRRTNVGKADWARYVELAGDRQIVQEDDYNAVHCWAAAMRDTPEIEEVFNLCPLRNRELTLVWDDVTGVRCKARLDAWFQKSIGAAIADIKSAASGHPRGFRSALRRYHYHHKAAFYVRGAKACGLLSGEVAFCWCVVEKSRPYATGRYDLDAGEISRLQDDVTKRLVEYVEAKRTGYWPGYGQQDIQL